MSNVNVLIVGMGNIGFRHCESLMKSKRNLRLYLVDNNNKILIEKKKILKKKLKSNIKLFFFKNISHLNENLFFLTILATNCNIRFDIFNYLIKNFTTKFCILEKIAFNNIYEYRASIKLSSRNNVKTFINCPRRVYEIFKYVKKKINKKKIEIEYFSNNWSMASNMIHFFDLFQWFVGAKEALKDNFSFEPRLIRSKRKGYYEVKGTIHLRTNKNNKLEISDSQKYLKNYVLIKTKKELFYIFDNILKIVKNKKTILKKKFPSNLQSSLTSKLLEELLAKKNCSLTTLSDGYLTHKILYKILNKHFIKYLYSKKISFYST